MYDIRYTFRKLTKLLAQLIVLENINVRATSAKVYPLFSIERSSRIFVHCVDEQIIKWDFVLVSVFSLDSWFQRCLSLRASF